MLVIISIARFSEFDTHIQASGDLELDTLVQSEDVSNNLDRFILEDETYIQASGDLGLDTLAQSEDIDRSFNKSISDFDRDVTDIFAVSDEFFPDTQATVSTNLNIEVDRSESFMAIDRAELVESMDDLPDLLDSFFDEPVDFDLADRSFIETSESVTFDSMATVTEVNAVAGALAPEDSELQITASKIGEPTLISADVAPINADVATNPATSIKRSVQIPVPLERLDKSAQQVVETLLTARAVNSISTQLQAQLDRLTTLTRENSQFVTRLRQLQDDYALLRNLSDEQQDSGNNVTLERYRQGYSTIVRLLENILRLSELGQEIESSTYQSAIRMEALDRSILQLKDGIEASRLVPFRNLTLRSKAILRDLTNRYGKPAELIVKNDHIELDAGIVQQLEPALLHLLRNAYDRGLEPTLQRLAAGKAAQGKIAISLQQQGNLYVLTIEDDGGGIDAELIHNLALAKGFSLNQTRTNAELLAVICQPGFSSSSTINEVSGPGCRDGCSCLPSRQHRRSIDPRNLAGTGYQIHDRSPCTTITNSLRPLPSRRSHHRAPHR